MAGQNVDPVHLYQLPGRGEADIGRERVIDDHRLDGNISHSPSNLIESQQETVTKVLADGAGVVSVVTKPMRSASAVAGTPQPRQAATAIAAVRAIERTRLTASHP